VATPSTQIVSIWIKEELVLDQWVSLRALAIETLKRKWDRDEFDILEFLQDKLPYIADHLRDDLANLECPAFFEPVALIETGVKGAFYGTTEEAYG